MKYEIMSGAYIGSIVEEGETIVSHLGFINLSEDDQLSVREFGEKLYPLLQEEEDFPVSLNEILEAWENSWESQPVEE